MSTYYSGFTISYRLSTELTGFAHGLHNYIRRLPIKPPTNARVLDLGCGTGVLGISMKKTFPKITVLATDLEGEFLSGIQVDIKKHNFPRNEFRIGIADINSPENVLLTDKQIKLVLNPETFDVVMVGAVLGYSSDPRQSIVRLLKLVKPGGYFINIEMSESLIGKILSNFFKYRSPGITNTMKILKENGCVVKKVPFLLTELPAGLSRTGIIAQKIYE